MIFGQLYSKKSKKLLSLCVSTSGYYSYNTRINGKNKLFRIHRLVAQTFIPNLENKPFVNHKDGDKLNNISRNYISKMTKDEVYNELSKWSKEYDKDFYERNIIWND